MPFIHGIAKALSFKDVSKMTSTILAGDFRPLHAHGSLHENCAHLCGLQPKLIRDLGNCHVVHYYHSRFAYCL